MTLLPDEETQLYGRSGFFLHGSTLGNGYGSAGCTDLNTEDGRIFDVLRSQGAEKIKVTVKYDQKLKSNIHPVYAKRKDLEELRSGAVAQLRSAVQKKPIIARDKGFASGIKNLFGSGGVKSVLGSIVSREKREPIFDEFGNAPESPFVLPKVRSIDLFSEPRMPGFSAISPESSVTKAPQKKMAQQSLLSKKMIASAAATLTAPQPSSAALAPDAVLVTRPRMLQPSFLQGVSPPAGKPIPDISGGEAENEAVKVQIPIPARKPRTRASVAPTIRIAANPFELNNSQLNQQVALLERNPIRARQLIVAAGRDPELFGFAPVA